MPALYDDIGGIYQRSRSADAAIVAALSRLLRLEPDGRYLDLACGTGNYTRAVAAHGGAWHGVDASRVMLAQARAQASPVRWCQAEASRLPFRDGVFEGALCTLAIHHFADLDRPFTEVRRSLKCGCFVLFTGLAEQMHNYWLCHYFPEMMRRSIADMPTWSDIRTSLAAAGFESSECVPFFVTPQLRDLFLYAGKERPRLYLDDDVRANISSFARLCDDEELESGLQALREDLRSGQFDTMRDAYSSDGGDYAYVIGRVGT